MPSLHDIETRWLWLERRGLMVIDRIYADNPVWPRLAVVEVAFLERTDSRLERGEEAM